MTLYFQNPDTVVGNQSTIVVADVMIGRCHTCALLVEATCSDGILNQGEEMTDCGGDNCDPCAATEEDALNSCDTSCFDRPPASDPDYCSFSGFSSVSAGCAASANSYCDATCGTCVQCPRAKRPSTGSVECFGSNYLGQGGLTSSRSNDDAAYGDDYFEKLYAGGNREVVGNAAQLQCGRGSADECGCEHSFSGDSCSDVVNICDENPCMFDADCYNYFAVVNPVTGKSTPNFECDCDTAAVDDVSGSRCEIDEAPPVIACDTSLPVALTTTTIADYSFLTDPSYIAYCADSSGDYFPTSFSGGVPDCTGAVTTYWAADNIGIGAVSVTPVDPVDVCADSDFVSASTSHATFCSSGAGAPQTRSCSICLTRVPACVRSCDTIFMFCQVLPKIRCCTFGARKGLPRRQPSQ